MKTKLVGVNEKGYRIGEDHPQAKLSDADVELIRELHFEHGLSYGEIARKWDEGEVTITKQTVYLICTYQIRAQVAAAWKRKPVKEGGQ